VAIDWDAAMESLAFGKTTPKLSSCLGMYLSPEVIYISETRLTKGRPTVLHLIRIPVPPPEKPKAGATAGLTLNTDFLNDNTKLSGIIRQAMAQTRWESKLVIVTLSHHLSLLRYFTMPVINRQFWDTAVPQEAKKYIPIPFDALIHDFQVIPVDPSADGKERQGAMVAVTPSGNLPNISGLVESLGLSLLGMEVAPCSVLRTWNSLEGGKGRDPYCQVHFDGGNIRILITDKGIPVFFREVFLGPEAQVMDSRKVDLAGCVGFTQKQLGVAKLTQLRISGATPELAKWHEQFSKDTGIPATSHDTAALLGIKAGDWGGYASIGASLKYLSVSTITLDLANLGRIGPQEKLAAKYIFVITGLLAGALLLVGFFWQSLYTYRAKSIVSVADNPEIGDAFKGKTDMDIEVMLNQMQQQTSKLTAVGMPKTERTSAILNIIVRLLPERMWLTQIVMTRPLKNAGGTRPFPSMILTGFAAADSLEEEQDISREYRNALAEDKLIKRLFPDIQISVSGKPVDAAVMANQNQEELRRAMEKRTTFTIRGGRKKN